MLWAPRFTWRRYMRLKEWQKRAGLALAALGLIGVDSALLWGLGAGLLAAGVLVWADLTFDAFENRK